MGLLSVMMTATAIGMLITAPDNLKGIAFAGSVAWASGYYAWKGSVGGEEDVIDDATDDDEADDDDDDRGNAKGRVWRA